MATKITLQTVVDYETKMKSLQAKMLMMFDDEIQSLPKNGMERLMCVSRYASVFGRMWQFFTKQGLVMKETVQTMGGEVEISEDVPMEKLQDLIAIPIAPRRDRNLEGRAAPEAVIQRAEPILNPINIGTRPINVGRTEPDDDEPPPDEDEDEPTTEESSGDDDYNEDDTER